MDKIQAITYLLNIYLKETLINVDLAKIFKK